MVASAVTLAHAGFVLFFEITLNGLYRNPRSRALSEDEVREMPEDFAKDVASNEERQVLPIPYNQETQCSDSLISSGIHQHT